MPVKTVIRASFPSDGPMITELLAQSGLRSNTEPAQLQWKYWQQRPDCAEPRSLVMTRAGEIIAHAGIVPGATRGRGGRIRLMHLIDWAARSGYPGAGVALMKHAGRLTDALLAIGGSDQTLQILPHLGFKPLGVITGHVRTLRPAGILKSSSSSSWRRWGRFARSVLWTALADAGGRRRLDGWAIQRVDWRDTAALAAHLPAPNGSARSLERSVTLFDYVLGCPIAKMEFFAVRGGGKVGYFILALARTQARLVDCWIDSDLPQDWRALLQCAVTQARKYPSSVELIAWSGDAVMAGALRECGFHPRNTQTVQLLSGSPIEWPQVRLQMLDNDAAYMHDSAMDKLWA